MEALDPIVEEIGNGDSKEKIPHQSRRKMHKTLREEHENKEIMMGSPLTIVKCMRTSSKSTKSHGNSVPPRGGIVKHRTK